MCFALTHVEERIIGQQVDATYANPLASFGGIDHADEVRGIEAVRLAHVDEHPFVAILACSAVFLAIGFAVAGITLLLLASRTFLLLGNYIEHWSFLVVLQ